MYSSNLVNTLLGRDLLPTNAEVATSQVFNVRPSGWQAYLLRFEEGFRREIALEELWQPLGEDRVP